MPTNVVKRTDAVVRPPYDNYRGTEGLDHEVVAVFRDLRNVTHQQPVGAQEARDFHFEELRVDVEGLREAVPPAMLANELLQLG